MNVYIAGPWKDRAQMPEIASKFEAQGHRMTWKWWETPDINEGEGRENDLREQAENDVNGVMNAEVIVLINSSKSEGKAVEQGMAIAAGKDIIAVGRLGDGKSMNVFHYLPNYKWVETVEEAIECLHTTK